MHGGNLASICEVMSSALLLYRLCCLFRGMHVNVNGWEGYKVCGRRQALAVVGAFAHFLGVAALQTPTFHFSFLMTPPCKVAWSAELQHVATREAVGFYEWKAAAQVGQLTVGMTTHTSIIFLLCSSSTTATHLNGRVVRTCRCA